MYFYMKQIRIIGGITSKEGGIPKMKFEKSCEFYSPHTRPLIVDEVHKRLHIAEIVSECRVADWSLSLSLTPLGGGGGGDSNTKMPGCVCRVSENEPILNDTFICKTYTHIEGILYTIHTDV